MPKVTYVQADGSRTTCQLACGASVMDGALDNNIAGITGQCGGGCTCATCHCYVDWQFLPRLDPACGDELDLLDYLEDRRDNSRLSCQIRVSADVDGLIVEIPARQS
jgi:ferredoxin, 2Fe-2S